MPINTASMSNNVTWSLTRVNSGGYRSTSQGPESQSFSLNGLNTSTFNQIATYSYSIASGATQSVDLTNLTNLVFETFSLSKVLTVIVQPFGGQVTYAPAAASGLNWFLTGTNPAIVIPASGFFAFSLGALATGQTVDSGHKFLNLTAGAASATVDLIILGGT